MALDTYDMLESRRGKAKGGEMRISYEAQGISRNQLDSFTDFSPRLERISGEVSGVSKLGIPVWSFEIPDRGKLFREGKRAEAEALRLRLKEMDKLFNERQVI